MLRRLLFVLSLVSSIIDLAQQKWHKHFLQFFVEFIQMYAGFDVEGTKVFVSFFVPIVFLQMKHSDFSKRCLLPNHFLSLSAL